MSYTAQAIEWADEVGMGLFRFNHAGEVEAINRAAGSMLERAEHEEIANSGIPTSTMPHLVWAYTPACDDAAA